MVLVDKQILLQVNAGRLICKGFKQENLHGISYDILIDSVIVANDEKSIFVGLKTYNLRSGETIFVEADIELCMPHNCIGRIVERNSVMRMGLEVSGPCYQPGHRTKIFLRVRNISSNDISLHKGQGIAQIMFEYLPIAPEKPYSEELDHAYQDELQYTGVQGEWRSDWLGQLEKYDKKIEELDNTENRIYGNIITIMGVFITIFSLLTFDFAALSNSNITLRNIIGIDLSLTLLLYILLGMIIVIVNKRRRKSFYFVYFIVLAILLTINILGWVNHYFF